MPEAVLVGDIGGTNARFAMANLNGSGRPKVSDMAILAGDDYPSFDAALSHYLDDIGDHIPHHALFAIAGPVRDNSVSLTNRNWRIDGRSLEAEFDFKQVRLVNDYAAMARSIPELPDECFRVLNEGNPPVERAPILVAGPGTGLGMATLLPQGTDGWSVLTGEGGHAAFAPANDREWALAKSLQKAHGFLPNELIVAGMGLDEVHRALCEIDSVEWVQKQPAEIMALARQGDRISRDICTIRAGATMSALADAALINGTRGGVVITGGVAERLVDWLEQSQTLSRFFERGPREDYMRAIPIRLLLSGEAALIGAAALYFDQEGGI